MILLVAVYLVLQLGLKVVLHFAFPIEKRLRHNLVFLRSEVSLAWCSNLVAIIHFAHTIHLDLFEHDLADGLFLLLTLDVHSHVKSIVLFLKSLQLSLILDFTLLCAQKFHFEAFASVAHH